MLDQPLWGRSVLVTRPAGQEQRISRLLRERGAVVWHWPALSIGPPADWGPVDAAIRKLPEFDWVVFSSANGVRGFLDRMAALGVESAFNTVAAIGPATALALVERGVAVELVPGSSHAEQMSLELVPPTTGKRVLIVRTEKGRDYLEKALSSVARLESVSAYTQMDTDMPAETLARIRDRSIDFVLVSSGNVARNLHRCLRDSGGRSLPPNVIAISPRMAKLCNELGFPVIGTADRYDDEGLVAATVKANRGGHSNPNRE